MTPLTLEPGRTHPIGATPDAAGVNFSLFSLHATAVTLLIFEAEDAPAPALEIPLDPLENKTFYFWHVYVRGLRPGACYAYRVDGPHDPDAGFYFNPAKVLIDPYARGLSDVRWDRSRAVGPGDNVDASLRSVVVAAEPYDWEGVTPPGTSMRETIIYELHVGGFTKSPTSGVGHPGTFAGMVEKIPYLQALGVTAVELMPVFAFDETEVNHSRKNYWGYSPLAFFTPHNGFCVSPEERRQIDEFRDMVKAFHRAGIEVILDVVFNHTTEGNHLGPAVSFKGIDAPVYYHMDGPWFRDFSGCGNTLNCNQPLVVKFIRDCLKFWAGQMHVDGFRFDEGSILSRGEDGRPMGNPPIVWSIELSDRFADKKIIAEAWDAAGLYQVGYFPGRRWAEWNGHYRDDIRRFLKGDRGVVGRVASRIAGSADIYDHRQRFPINSINFVTCHDGFTLNDLVSYNGKHNEANGEDNRDGMNDNMSWNHGVEGPTDDPAVEALRNRVVKNACAILMVSQGVPMIGMGDEVRRTQYGNNNAYCQDNPISWLDWDLLDRHADVLRFFRQLIAFRKRTCCLTRPRYLTGALNERGLPDIGWHGCELNAPGWDDPRSGVLAFTIGGLNGCDDVHVMMNMEDDALSFALPTVPGRRWHRFADTALPAPHDVAEFGEEIPIAGDRYLVTPRSVVILVSRPTDG